MKIKLVILFFYNLTIEYNQSSLYNPVKRKKQGGKPMDGKTRELVKAALFAALACVATMVIKIPSPLGGYLNLGDCVVLAAGWLLAPGYGFLAAGIGSALADVFSGYIVYAPATFLIKGLMALIAFFGGRALRGKLGELGAEILSGAAAELWMVAGYYVFEGFVYGFAPSAVNIPANGVQGAAGLILGVLLVKALEKSRIAKA